MGLKEMFKKRLTPELLTQVEDALGDDFDYDMVPRSRLNKVIKQRNEYKEQLSAMDTEAKEDDDDDEDDDEKDKGAAKKSTKTPDVAALKAEIDRLKLENAKAVEDLKLQYAVLDKLRDAKAIDPDLIMKSGLIDKTKLAYNDKGELTGLDEQLTDLVKNKAFLFQGDEGGAGSGTGKGSGGSGGGTSALDTQLDSIFAGYGVTPIKQ
jgi:hypothetical protein